MVFTCLSITNLSSQVSHSTQVSLLTCDPGEALYSTFGHSAIRVFDPEQNLDVVYNYGTFDFNEPNFYIKFLRGKLLYKLSRYGYSSFLNEYHREQRGVREQVFELDSLQKSNFINALEENYKPENQYYLYDFFFDNCSSRIRDIAEDHIPGFSYTDTRVAVKTYRQMLDEYLGNMAWSDFGIDLIIGAVADKEAGFRSQMFLPDYLHDHMEKAQVTKGNLTSPMITSDQVVLQFEEDNIRPKWFTPALLLWIFFLIEAVLYILNFMKKNTSKALRFYDGFWYLLLGLSGLVMLFMWFGTNHQACGQNWNLLWANPLYFLTFIFLWLKKPNPDWKYLFYLLLSLNIVTLACWYIIPQQFHIAFIPICLLMLLKIYRNQSSMEETKVLS